MSEAINNLGITLPEDEKFSSGIGYIALPADIDRQTYLKDCYQNMRVSIHTAHDGFMNRVMISEEDLNWIDFPMDYKSLGTPVFYMVDDVKNQPYIVKRFGKTSKLGDGKENGFRIGRMLGDSVVEISGNPNEGFLNLVVSNDKKSSFNVNVVSEDNNAYLNLNVKGTANISASGNINLTANGQVYSRVFDADSPEIFTEVYQSINSIKTNAPTFSINNGKENFVLGQKYKKLLEDILQKFNDFTVEVSNITVTTPDGVFFPNNKVQLTAYKAQIELLEKEIDGTLSEVGYIDK